MKYVLMLTSFCLTASLLCAQTYRVQQCVIENGTLKNISADYDPATGNYSINVSGTKKSLNEVYPALGSNYAGSASWYINNEKIIVNGQKFVKYGLPRILGTTEIEKVTEYNRVGVYVEAGAKGTQEVIYIPTQRGCEFQPYMLDKFNVVEKKIYYDENWIGCSKSKAAFYRLVNVNGEGQPVGLVKDYYINGTQQWQGSLSYLDVKDNSKDIIDGVCAWFHPNGSKAEEVYYVKGKQQGVYKSWAEDGSLQREIEYKNGVLHGYFKTYSPEGRLLTTEYYVNGNKTSK